MRDKSRIARASRSAGGHAGSKPNRGQSKAVATAGSVVTKDALPPANPPPAPARPEDASLRIAPSPALTAAAPQAVAETSQLSDATPAKEPAAPQVAAMSQ